MNLQSRRENGSCIQPTVIQKSMPTLQLLSDIHLEFFEADDLMNYLDQLDGTGVDVLVLAGDICSLPLLPLVLGAFADAYAQVVAVMGNHELYGSDFETVRKAYSDLPSNVHLLDHSEIVVAGVHFVGGTLWFRDQAGNEQLAPRLNDFHQIKDFSSRVYDEQRATEACIRQYATPESVVVTHHLPTKAAVPPRFVGSELTRFFLCDMEEVEVSPRLWLFGHTHWHVDVTLGATRFVANPTGYRGNDDSGHIPRLLLEI